MEALREHRFGGHTLDCPVTVAWGAKDRLLIYSRQSARARRLLPDARHVTLHGCGHVPTWDDPEQVARVLLEGSSA
jgi:pimeloyl-ACP methyl ester carboxylesterase